MRVPDSLAMFMAMSMVLVEAFVVPGRNVGCHSRSCVNIINIDHHRPPHIAPVLQGNVVGRDDGEHIEPSHDAEGKDSGKRRRTTVRAGGRGLKPELKSRPSTERSSKFPTGWLGAFTLGLLLLWAFSGNNNDNIYYYSYSSSVYETRSYTQDGKVESQRKESSNFRSNLPGLQGNPSSASELLRED